MGEEYGPETCLIQGEVKPLGHVLLYDDMEGVVKWGTVDRLTGGKPQRRGDAAYQGRWGIRISARVVRPNGWAWTYAGRSVGLRGHKHVRASLVFKGRAFLGAKGCRLWLRYYDGTYRWTGSYEYVFQAGDAHWHCLSLEMDFHKGVYVGGWLDGKDLGISGNTLSRYTTGSPEVLYVIVGVADDLGFTSYLHFDLVLVQEV